MFGYAKFVDFSSLTSYDLLNIVSDWSWVMSKLRYLDLFAGAGGLSEGFSGTGFLPVSHVEMDTAACYTLKTRLAYNISSEKRVGVSLCCSFEWGNNKRAINWHLYQFNCIRETSENFSYHFFGVPYVFKNK